MNNSITYSILQYRYSPILNESLNIGVLFYFPDENRKLHFFHTDHSRVKSVYKDIDTRFFYALLKLITAKTENVEINKKASSIENFDNFLDHFILKKDDTVFQFSEPYKVWNVYQNIDSAIHNYVEILLPKTKKEKKNSNINPNYAIKEIKYKLSKEIPSNKLDKIDFDFLISFQNFKMKADFCWKGRKNNIVKILNFDLANRASIQKKAAEYFGYLNYLEDYLYKNNSKIHLILLKPHKEDLINVYKDSKALLGSVNSSSKEIVLIEEKADSYIDFVKSNI